MPEPTHYDAIIIGSGQAGGPLSTALANEGYNSALIEQAHVGGTCINYGCTPTKTMVASARVAYLNRRARDYGVEHSSVRSIRTPSASANGTSSSSSALAANLRSHQRPASS